PRILQLGEMTNDLVQSNPCFVRHRTSSVSESTHKHGERLTTSARRARVTPICQNHAECALALVPQSDIYALGMTAYELFGGDMPLAQSVDPAVALQLSDIPDLPQALSDAIRKAVNWDVQRRWLTPIEFSDAVATALGFERSAAQGAFRGEEVVKEPRAVRLTHLIGQCVLCGAVTEP
ncbi:MAG: hypothetical protein AB1560_14190, partial [Pseudomonadota bacterium]